jgi:hypothetical protein
MEDLVVQDVREYEPEQAPQTPRGHVETRFPGFQSGVLSATEVLDAFEAYKRAAEAQQSLMNKQIAHLNHSLDRLQKQLDQMVADAR